jgi:two-component system sensor histidine kinase/response regulator
MDNPALDLQGAEILIVDDVPDNVRLLSNTLSEQSYRVRGVTSGSMALMASRSAPPDLILLDINMPEMDGYEVCQKLKADADTHHIPVIFLSALDDSVSLDNLHDQAEKDA